MLKKCLCAAFLLLGCSAGFASQLPDYPFVHVSGIAYVRAIPDMADISFEVHVAGQDAESALATATEKLNEIKTTLSQQGVVEADMEFRDLKKEIKGTEAAPAHELNYSAFIKIRDLSQWQALMQSLLKLPNIDRLEAGFDSTQRDKIELELSAEAAKDAQRRATVMAAALGKKLAGVAALSDGHLRNIGSAIGLVSSNSHTSEVERRETMATELLMIPLMKLQASVDAVFKIK
jgi:uncharacterized protein YggE